MGQGNVIGKPNLPATTVASGVWSLREQYGASRTTTWPSTVPPIPPDPFRASTVAILNFNGTNGSTTMVDNSPIASNWIVEGTAKLTTSFKKFGVSGLDLSGGTGYIKPSAASSNFSFSSSQDYTLEAWIYPTDVTKGIIFDSRWGGWNYYTLQILNSGGLQLIVDPSSSALVLNTGTGFIAANAWTHVAACRASNTTRLFINGTLRAQAADSYSYTGVGGNRPTLGTDGNGPYYGPSQYFGYMDSIRITRAARYTASFAVPTGDFPTT